LNFFLANKEFFYFEFFQNMYKNKTDKPEMSKNAPAKPTSKPPSSKSNKQNVNNNYPKSVPNVPNSENIMKTNETHYSFKSSTTLGGLTNNEEPNSAGESVKVALRIRPLNNMEIGRGDQNCVKVINEQACQIAIT